MELYIAYLGDFFDDIPLLFDEDDPSTVVAKEHVDPHLHSLFEHSFEIDMIVDTLINQLVVALSLEPTLESLTLVLYASLVHPNLSFLAKWQSKHDLEAPFSIEMRTLE